MTFKITKHNSIPYAFKDHSYRIHKPKQGSHNNRILNKIFTLTEAMLSHYQRVFVVRIDLHMKEYSADNKILSDFLRVHNKKLAKEYGCIVGQLAVREQGTSDQQHYHLALFLNGGKIKHSGKLVRELTKLWKAHCGGFVPFKTSAYMMLRGDKASIDPAIYRLSYLTKKLTKENNTKAKDFLNNKVPYKHACYEAIDNDVLLVNPEITLAYNQEKQIALPPIESKWILSSFNKATYYGRLLLPVWLYSSSPICHVLYSLKKKRNRRYRHILDSS